MKQKRDNAVTVDLSLKNINYAFFTNENGQSDAGYLIDNNKTRNVNLYSSEQPVGKGYDPVENILANIQSCFTELGAVTAPNSHKFFMTTYYAAKGAPLIVSCDDLSKLSALKQEASDNISFQDTDKTNPKRLGIEPNMQAALKQSDISVVRADALIFKGVPGHSIAVLGASGDAHPIMMFDDVNQIGCYISGAHANLAKGVLEQSFNEMVKMGADKKNIRLVIGAGLGPRSYEFGANALDYLKVPRALTPVKDSKGEDKYLVNIKELVIGKLEGALTADQIFDTELDTMAFDLYQESKETKELKRRETVNFKELNANGPLFFGARRSAMEKTEDLFTKNPGLYSEVGRHGAGFKLG